MKRRSREKYIEVSAMKLLRSKKALFSLFGLIATLVGDTSFAREQLKFNYVGTFSSLSLYERFEGPFWKKHIPEESKGKITTKVTTFPQMGLGGSEVFKLLKLGVFDIGSTVAGYTVQDAPELEGLDMPMMAPSLADARRISDAYRSVMSDTMAKRYGGAKLLSIVPYGPQMVFCNTPISGLNDLKSKKIRASGRTTGEFLKAIGAQPIILDFGEVPGGLQRGVIDCAVTAPLPAYDAGWYEVTTHLYPLAVGGWDHVVTAMNGDKWKSLSPEEQSWLESKTLDYEGLVWDSAAGEFQEGIDCLSGSGDCSRGPAAKMVLVNIAESDHDFAEVMLQDVVIPKWANRVDKESRDRWNTTIGVLTGLSAESH